MMEGSSPAPHTITVKAPAKINWFLKVLGLRKDGYHEIQSLMQKVNLYDTLTFAPADELTVSGMSGIPAEKNLVYEAARILKYTYSISEGATIHIDKKIPMEAGLGGGSSDAAAALVGLNRIWALDLSVSELCRIGERIGSDVPFFLFSPMSLVHGRGERIIPRRAVKPLTLLLVKPSISVSTAWAYREFADPREGGSNDIELTKKADKVDNIELFIRSIETADTSGIAVHSGAVSNDLESVTLKSFPVIARIKEKLREEGSVFALMSGSGSAVFGVFDSMEKAEDASGCFNEDWNAVVQTITD